MLWLRHVAAVGLSKSLAIFSRNAPVSRSGVGTPPPACPKLALEVAERWAAHL